MFDHRAFAPDDGCWQLVQHLVAGDFRFTQPNNGGSPSGASGKT